MLALVKLPNRKIRLRIAHLFVPAIMIQLFVIGPLQASHYAPLLTLSTESFNQRIPSIDDRLRQKGIGLDRASLLAALHNSDSEVRMLAANKLSDEKDTEAVPFIRSALAAETVPINRIQLSLFLARLGDPMGKSLLKNACSNPQLAGYLRMAAAAEELILEDDVCLPDIVTVLRFYKDWGSLTAALSLVPRYVGTSNPATRSHLINVAGG